MSEPIPPTVAPVFVMVLCISFTLWSYVSGETEMFAISLAGMVASAGIAAFARVYYDVTLSRTTH